MSEKYLIPQFIIDYIYNSRSTNSKSKKIPQRLASALLVKNKTPEIEKWFKDNKVTAGYLWKYFLFYGLKEFSFRECLECGKRIKLDILMHHPNAKYCSHNCTSLSKEIREKVKHTCLEKYGVESVLHLKTIRERGKQTCIEKYGVEHPSQSKEIQKKKKETFIKHYGVKHYSQSKESKHILRSNYWETFCLHLKQKDIVPLFTKEDYINDTGRKFKCLICGEEFESEGTSEYMKEHRYKDGSYKTLQVHCIYCPHCSRKFSRKEKEVLEFVRAIYEGEILENDRKQLDGKELDIYIPSLNLGIEFNGDYWHSFERVKENDKIKNALCEQRGITLLRIKESEWDNNREQVKTQIKKLIQVT